MARQQVTQSDIAKRLGLSTMTVSRALRNDPHLAAPTRSQILQMANRLGYRPNPMVSALMRYRRTGRANRMQIALGFITNFATRDGWKTSPLNCEVFNGAAACAEGHGFRLQEFWLREPRMSGQRLSQVLYARNIAGLLIAPLPVAIGHLRLDWPNFAAVALGYSLAWPSLHRVVDQQFHSMRLAMHHLRKLGYHRPGLVLRPAYDQSAHHHWTAGFLVEQESRAPGERVPFFAVQDSQWNDRVFQKWFRKYRPDALLAFDEQPIEWLREIGLRVPQEAGFVHLNCPDTSGRYAGIYHNGAAVGAAAIDFLVDMIHRNERGIPDLARWLLVEGTWQHGATLRRVPPHMEEGATKQAELSPARLGVP